MTLFSFSSLSAASRPLKTTFGAAFLALFGVSSLPLAGSVMLGMGASVAISAPAIASTKQIPGIGIRPKRSSTAKGIKDPAVKGCGSCGLTGRARKDGGGRAVMRGGSAR